jgi:XTP/dITP diphosphohydrolase
MSNVKILFASSNPNKLREIRLGFGRFGIDILAPESVLDVAETEGTYFGNARLKADAYGEFLGVPCLSDDSGIEVGALDWQPGVHSARFAGVGASSRENNRKLLLDLYEKKDRSARMRSVLCLRLAEGQYLFTEGVLEGHILSEPRGEGGWGYEPLFCLAPYNKSIAELRDEGVDFETHRTRSIATMAERIVQLEL